MRSDRLRIYPQKGLPKDKNLANFPGLFKRLMGESAVHGSRHRRKHPKGRRKVGRKKRRMMRKRRQLRSTK
jgi:hypothetical protein